MHIQSMDLFEQGPTIQAQTQLFKRQKEEIEKLHSLVTQDKTKSQQMESETHLQGQIYLFYTYPHAGHQLSLILARSTSLFLLQRPN